MKKSDDTDLFVPIIASSLLNAIYSRILITSPLQFDDQVFQREATAVIQQWEVLKGSIQTSYLQRQVQTALTQKKAAEFLQNEMNQVQLRLAEISALAQTVQLQEEKKILDDKLQVLLVFAERFQI